jgi:phosphate transport system substrate-binding protein
MIRGEFYNMKQSLRYQCAAVFAGVIGGLLAWSGAVSADQTGPEKPRLDPALVAYQPTERLSGAFTIAGSETMQPLMIRLASEFRRLYPNTKIAVQGGGTDAALGAFVQGIASSRRGDGNVKGHLAANEVSLLASSRPLTEEEINGFQTRHGYAPTEIPIALGAVTLYVNQRNPIQGLTLKQVDAIFSRDRKRGYRESITTWGQLGLAQEWKDQPIHLYGRDARSGTRDFFKQEALLDGEYQGDIHEEVGPASVILAIIRDPHSIGYAGIGFQTPSARAVPLAEKEGMPFVSPTAEAAASGAYPLHRSLYLYLNKEPAEPLQPAIYEFLKFANSREGQAAVAKAGVYPLSSTQAARNLAKLDPRMPTAVPVAEAAR